MGENKCRNYCESLLQINKFRKDDTIPVMIGENKCRNYCESVLQINKFRKDDTIPVMIGENKCRNYCESVLQINKFFRRHFFLPCVTANCKCGASFYQPSPTPVLTPTDFLAHWTGAVCVCLFERSHGAVVGELGSLSLYFTGSLSAVNCQSWACRNRKAQLKWQLL